MKNIKPLILFALFGVLFFAQTASGQSTARDTRNSNEIAISPYAQAVPNDSYTFIGISHPSLDTASSAIGLVVEVVGMTTTVNSQAGRSAVFTVNAGETHRVFVVNQSHSTINSSNSSFTDSLTHLIPTVDSSQFGSVRVTTIDESPNNAVVVNSKNTYENLAQLSMWGIVYVEAGGAGFAMEFIGDMQDSLLVGNLGQLKAGSRGAGTVSANTPRALRPGAGIN